MKYLIRYAIFISLFLIAYVSYWHIILSYPMYVALRWDKVVKHRGKFFVKAGLKMNQLTIDPFIQPYIERKFSRFDTPYISVILLNPSTGDIKGFYEKGDILNKTIKSASIFKVFTLIAALSSDSIGPYDPVAYSGKPHSSKPSQWKNGKENMESIKDAFGESNNPAFGNIGKKIGIEQIKRTTECMFLGRKLFGINTGFIRDTVPLEFLSSGLRGVYISPLYAALIAQTISNDGRLIIPRMVKRGGRISMGRVIDKSIARWVREISVSTLENGTASKYYKKASPAFKMGGKTGSITGIKPSGWYEWFVGWAPVDKPKVAIVVLGIHKEIKYFSSSQMGIDIMNRFLERERRAILSPSILLLNDSQ